MSSKTFQVVLVQHGNGFLNGLFPDFARMLDDMFSVSSALGFVLSERSYRGDVLRFNQWCGDRPIDKALIEKYLKYLSNKNTPPPTSPASWPPYAGTSTASVTCFWTMPPCAACCRQKNARPSLRPPSAARRPRLRAGAAPSASKPAGISRSPSSTSLCKSASRTTARPAPGIWPYSPWPGSFT